MKLNVLILQHADDEWIGNMEPWFALKHANLHTIRVDKGEILPSIYAYDWLVVLGGPMSAYDEINYPWLVPEKALIKQAIESNKVVLGICLGGQLIANALGGKVKPNSGQEIGWFEVNKVDQAATWLPECFKPLSWHGDTFELPEGAVALAKSEITPHQGFTLGDKVVALQFHLEARAGTAKDFLQHEKEGLPEGKFVQEAQDILEDTNYLEESRKVMYALLERLI